MRERLPVYDILQEPEDWPIAFSGTPRALVGNVRLRNQGDAKVLLRQAIIHDPRNALRTGADTIAHHFHPVVLRPAEARSLTLSLDLGSRTPPGTYHCEMTVAGRKRPVVLYVAEDLDLDLEPSTIVLENRPGSVQRKQVIVHNLGNVPLTIGEIGEVFLEEEMIWCRAQRAAIESWIEDPEGTVQGFIAATLRAAHGEAFRSGALLVELVDGPVPIAPGEVASLTLAIQVPERLHRNGRYKGYVPLYTEDLSFQVVPSPENVARASRRPERDSGRKTSR